MIYGCSQPRELWFNHEHVHVSPVVQFPMKMRQLVLPSVVYVPGLLHCSCFNGMGSTYMEIMCIYSRLATRKKADMESKH